MEKAIELAPDSVKDHYKKNRETLKADRAKKASVVFIMYYCDIQEESK